MPILAVLITSLASALASFFVKFLSVGLAVKLAAYSAWMVVFSAFLVSVYVCISSLLAMTQSAGGGGGGGPDWVSYFWMGLGMFIPANAGAVLSCVASIWIATYIYKTQQHAIFNFAK